MNDPHLRARDADRERTVELIEAAYVDGQLSSEDRDLRVSNALTASTFGELGMLTRDLQSDHLAVAPPARRRRSPAGLVVVGTLAAVLAVGAFFVVRASTDEAAQPDAVVAREPAPEVVVEQQAPAEPEPVPVPTFAMTPVGMRDFVAAYETQFGTTDVLGATFYQAGYVILAVPTRGNAKRNERWTYRDGEFEKDADAVANTRGERPVDLLDLRINRLFANVKEAKRTLKVERPELTHVNLTNAIFGDATEVNIYVSNKFRESGYLSTTLAGKIQRRHPFEA